MEKRILIIDDDPTSTKLVSSLLKTQGYRIASVASAKQGLSIIEDQSFDLILLDVLMPEMDGYELCRILRSNPDNAQLPIVLLTALDTLEQKIRGFDVGADDYIAKPFEPKELIARIESLLRRTAQSQPVTQLERVGKVISVFSLRGGSGASTIASNLSVGLAQLWDTPVVYVDLVHTAGHGALFLNLPLRKTWAELATIPDEDIDIDLLEMLTLPHASGARVLAAPVRPEHAELISEQKIKHVLNLLQSYYEYLVLDLPHDFSATTLAGLDISDEIIIPLSPEIASVRSVSVALSSLKSLQIPPNDIHLLMNWTFRRGGLSREDIESALKHSVKIMIPHAPDPLVKAINVGIPPVFSSPETPLGAIFEDLAYRFSKPEHKKDKPSIPTEAWERVRARAKKRRKR